MENKIYFYHGTTTDGRRFTLAGRYEIPSDNHAELIIGLSICSKRDQFIKKLGRVRSQGRSLSNDNFGKFKINLYSSSVIMPDPSTKNKDWFVGKEIFTFISIAKSFNNITARQLIKRFNLDNDILHLFEN